MRRFAKTERWSRRVGLRLSMRRQCVPWPCRNGRGFACFGWRYVDAGNAGFAWQVGWGFAGPETLVSSGLESDFWSLCMVLGIHGKTRGEMACAGNPRKTYGEMRQAWERRRRMGGRQAAWGAKIALKPGIWERWRPAGFACFYEFLAGGGGPAFATVKASHRACCECRGA